MSRATIDTRCSTLDFDMVAWTAVEVKQLQCDQRDRCKVARGVVVAEDWSQYSSEMLRAAGLATSDFGFTRVDVRQMQQWRY